MVVIFYVTGFGNYKQLLLCHSLVRSELRGTQRPLNYQKRGEEIIKTHKLIYAYGIYKALHLKIKCSIFYIANDCLRTF